MAPNAPNRGNETSRVTTSATTNTLVDSADVTRWMELFGYDGTEALAAILAHRNDPSVHVSDMKWLGVQWGHEKAGYNKEAYEHLLVLKASVKREKEARANRMKLYEWVGEYMRINLEGILTMGSLRQILSDDEIGTADSEDKWCYIQRSRLNEDKILAWIKRILVAVARGKVSYNKVWRTAIAEKGESTTLARAGFHSVPPSSNPDGNHNNLRVGIAKIDDDGPIVYPLQATILPQYVRNPFVNRSRLISPQLPFKTGLRRAFGMDLFWQNYRTDPHIQLPEFGNSPRVFPLPAEVVTTLRPRHRVGNSRNHAVRNPEVSQSSPSDVTQPPEPDRLTNERLSPWFKRLPATGGRSRIHWMEVLFGGETPRNVSSMMIREIVVANALWASDSLSESDPSIIATSTTPPFPELWSQFYLPPTRNSSLQTRIQNHSPRRIQ
ncbi:hypothetical protein BKA61DRAFT_679896 [Leptodontidium sp. MPI-SDFR-AT-0119]|nr:hypothetical protein BKA61DRAFT_679896 [Leptodontidium sp. MPI-SDFR-AT-0119]